MLHNEKYYQRHGIAIMTLARDLINYKKGDRIPTIAEYLNKINVSRGTLQNAFKELEKRNAISFSRRGVIGTYITSIDYKIMWDLTNWNTITGTMPLPLNLNLEGITAGICKEMANRNISFNFAFVQGALNRIRALNEMKYDFIVVSKATAARVKDNDNLEVALYLNEVKYSHPFSLYHNFDKFEGIKDGMSIAVDREALDQYETTMKLIGDKKVDIVYTSYISTLSLFLDKKVDLIVYRYEGDNPSYLVNRNDVSWSDLEENHRIEIPKEDEMMDEVKTAILVNKNNFGIKTFLQNNLSERNIIDVQKKVVAGEMTNKYY
jgi:hypothetical protein